VHDLLRRVDELLHDTGMRVSHWLPPAGLMRTNFDVEPTIPWQ
jgi:hypothetical protein